MTTIQQATNEWLLAVGSARAKSTHNTYKIGIEAFMRMLEDDGIKPTYSVEKLKEKHLGAFAAYLKPFSTSTEQVYLTALKGFYSFLVAEEYNMLNMERVKMIIQQRARKPKVRAPEFQEKDIVAVLEKISKIPLSPTTAARLRDLRDIALILLLADTGLRIGEACSLKRGDIDRKEGTIYVIGKGGKEATVIFDKRSGLALGRYLQERQALDGEQGKPLDTLPLFSRHDKATGKVIAPISTMTGNSIIHKRVGQVLGKDSPITPHQFRHYFVTMMYRAEGLKFAQESARHTNIQTTLRYTHLDKSSMKNKQRRALEGKSK